MSGSAERWLVFAPGRDLETGTCLIIESMKQEIRFCRSTDGVRIAYATTGKGPPLIRVSNWMTHLNLDWESPVWSHWFSELSRDHTLVRYDPRGTGLSDRDVDDFSIETWTRDLDAVVSDLGLDQFPLLGLCQGGAVAIAYAARHPDQVNHLVLYDSYLRGAYREGMPSTMKEKAQALEKMIEVGWGKEETAFRRVFADLLFPGATKRQQDWLTELQRQTVSPESASLLWRAFNDIDVLREARRVEVPTLVFHVRGDCMVPFDAGREVAAHIQDARFVPLEGHNHILLDGEQGFRTLLQETRGFLGRGTGNLEGEEGLEQFDTLTPRESEILELIARGLSNEQIADTLVIAPKTVRNHVSRVYSKLDVDSRAQAIITARKAGLGLNAD